VIEIVAWAEDCRLPLVALNVNVEDPSAAEEEAARVIDSPLVVMEKGDAGDNVTPLGRPAAETSIVWLNPFKGFTERLKIALCPGLKDWLCGLTPIVKLGDEEGPEPDEPEPPPHEDKPRTRSNNAKSWTICRDRLLRRNMPYFRAVLATGSVTLVGTGKTPTASRQGT
jgi:hypothetical protein